MIMKFKRKIIPAVGTALCRQVSISIIHGQCFHQETELVALISKELMGIIGKHKTNLVKNTTPCSRLH